MELGEPIKELSPEDAIPRGPQEPLGGLEDVCPVMGNELATLMVDGLFCA